MDSDFYLPAAPPKELTGFALHVLSAKRVVGASVRRHTAIRHNDTGTTETKMKDAVVDAASAAVSLALARCVCTASHLFVRSTLYSLSVADTVHRSAESRQVRSGGRSRRRANR